MAVKRPNAARRSPLPRNEDGVVLSFWWQPADREGRRRVDQPPVKAFLGRGMNESGIPRQRHRYGPTVGKFGGQSIFRYFDLHSLWNT